MVFPWDGGQMPRQGLGEFFGVTFLKNDGTIGSLTHPLSKDQEDGGRREKTRQGKIDPGPESWGRVQLSLQPWDGGESS